jgi:hypothetical protein
MLMLAFNDVEHYRPKTSADRLPGSTATHGYWWLAYTWDNLLFACPSCNRSNKNDLFPLEHGSTPLHDPDDAPGGERPLLLHPRQDNGVEHIEFVFTALPDNVPAEPAATALFSEMDQEHMYPQWQNQFSASVGVIA